MPKFGVTTQKEQELLRRMKACGLDETDLHEHFVSAGGPGGQKVNRTATCVYLKHGPSGLEVKMQQARSQALNRFYARRRLCELIEENQGDKQSPEAAHRAKLRKQKARRKKRASAKYDAGTETPQPPKSDA
jgi:protein subunit release factor B